MLGLRRPDHASSASDRTHTEEVSLRVREHDERVVGIVAVANMHRAQVEDALTLRFAVSRRTVHVNVHLVSVRHWIVCELQRDVAVGSLEHSERVTRSGVDFEA